jgi:hypothetical protein
MRRIHPAAEVLLLTNSSLECMNCGKKDRELYRLTGEDIQRKYDPDRWMVMMVCAQCRDALRAGAHLESNYSPLTAVKDFSLMAVLFAATIAAVSIVLQLFRVSVLGGAGRVSFLMGVLTTLSGLSILWNRLIDRYAYTHDIRWSIRSRRVVLGFSLVFAGILSPILLSYFPL